MPLFDYDLACSAYKRLLFLVLGFLEYRSMKKEFSGMVIFLGLCFRITYHKRKLVISCTFYLQIHCQVGPWRSFGLSCYILLPGFVICRS
jgi:hypothetical protein